MSVDSIKAKILVVDDERRVADAYALRLRSRYDVETAYSGEGALEQINPKIDVVLLDRRMPTVSGDKVLRKIRAQELGCRVIMVTAVDPDFGILDMPFDDYLCKPVDKESLFDAIDQQLRVVAYDILSEYFELSSKRAVIKAQLSEEHVQDSDEFDEIEERLGELEPRLRGLLDDFDNIAERFGSVDREI